MVDAIFLYGVPGGLVVATGSVIITIIRMRRQLKIKSPLPSEAEHE